MTARYNGVLLYYFSVCWCDNLQIEPFLGALCGKCWQIQVISVVISIILHDHNFALRYEKN